MQIEQLDVSSLVAFAANSRTHSELQVQQIVASIREFGFTNPVLVDAENGVIAGHGRLLAAESMGLDVVPCIRLVHLSDAQKRAYVIADNQIALNSGWDEGLLSSELAALNSQGFDLDLVGFDADELEGFGLDLLDAVPEPDVDVLPEPDVEVVSGRGDVWLCGDHRVMCGDSLDHADVQRLMDGKQAALLHADPPYGMGKEKYGVENDNLRGEALDAFQMAWWSAFRPSLVGNASVYIWGKLSGLWRLWYLGGLCDQGLSLRSSLVWRKPTPQGVLQSDRRLFASCYESCFFMMLGKQSLVFNSADYWCGWDALRGYLCAEMEKAGGRKCWVEALGNQMGSHYFTKSQWSMPTAAAYAKLVSFAGGRSFSRSFDCLRREYAAAKKLYDVHRLSRDVRSYFDNMHDKMTDVWDYPVVMGSERHGHVTPKPVAMMERVMRSSLPAGGLCVEPFGGSGSTLMGAERTGRLCYTMEITPSYVDLIVRRWQLFTGQQAVHAKSGRVFGADV